MSRIHRNLILGRLEIILIHSVVSLTQFSMVTVSWQKKSKEAFYLSISISVVVDFSNICLCSFRILVFKPCMLDWFIFSCAIYLSIVIDLEMKFVSLNTPALYRLIPVGYDILGVITSSRISPQLVKCARHQVCGQNFHASTY